MGKDAIVRSNQWMFRFVKCRTYMKKVRDGRCIVKLEKNLTEDGKEHYIYRADSGELDGKVADDDCGDLKLLKTYYKRTEKDFVGFVVGMKMIEVSAYLYLDYYCDNYREGYYVAKQTEEVKKCALVYYGCNKSRWVPLEDLEIMEGVI